MKKDSVRVRLDRGNKTIWARGGRKLKQDEKLHQKQLRGERPHSSKADG